MVDESKYARDGDGRERGRIKRGQDVSQVMHEFRVYRPDDERYSNLRGVIWLVLVIGLVALLVTGTVKLTGGSRMDDWTAPETRTLQAKSGELLTIAAGRFVIQGADPVKLQGVSADQPPEGLDVVDFRVGIDEGDGPLDEVRGPVDPVEWTLRGVPGVLIEPGSNDQLYLTVTLRAFEPGTYVLPDLIVRYEADRNTRGSLFRLDATLEVS